ncbi:hypothetical protein TNCV_1894161 [Trichonephila clavipes]|nr:hypothetical protein TNCV_1894161 [Trichonephila clavipes]
MTHSLLIDAEKGLAMALSTDCFAEHWNKICYVNRCTLHLLPTFKNYSNICDPPFQIRIGPVKKQDMVTQIMTDEPRQVFSKCAPVPAGGESEKDDSSDHLIFFLIN